MEEPIIHQAPSSIFGTPSVTKNTRSASWFNFQKAMSQFVPCGALLLERGPTAFNFLMACFRLFTPVLVLTLYGLGLPALSAGESPAKVDKVTFIHRVTATKPTESTKPARE